ncbi:ParB/Srx family N-terminal domain-containing protein [Cucumibacter marinus]|uniref:ParB/Srx family N-terminal domain-containing protein n=1 Tax=Cucumibacter marinus TaxID=1121252 RepID=UPI00138AFE3F|nr:ParB/Srx family N-terminal domain-containing protein [Cucumibacter marinus]
MNHQIADIELEKLHLDIANPRFGLFSANSEPEALTLLVDTANVKELWASIATLGFERFEPLITIADEKNPGHFVVIEGNRRLAACKTLENPELLGSRQGRVPRISARVRKSIQRLPVVQVKNRTDAESYIGFKHVNGPATWNSLAKARFGVKMLESRNDKRSLKDRMKELTSKLGDSRGMLLRVFVAFKIYEQAIAQDIISNKQIDTQKVQFSHLYTMLNNPQSREFIGLPATALSEESVIDDPVPYSHLDKLAELFGWLFGENSVIQSQGSDRPKLQKVLASREGLEALRASNDLNYAYATAGLNRADWLDQIHQCAALAKKIDGEALEVLTDTRELDTPNAKSTLTRTRQYIDSTLSKIQSAFD